MLSLLLLMSPILACVLHTELLVHDSSALTEASDITRVGDTYYVVKDEKFSITKVFQDGSLEVVGVLTGTDSDHEAIFRLPTDTNDADPTLIVCGEDTEDCSPYVGGIKQGSWSLVDGGDNCHSSIDFTNNKGVEGALGFTNDEGDVFMITLIEGSGKLVTYRLTEGEWISEGCTFVPEDLKDYSGMALGVTGDAEPVYRLVVTSQKSGAMWVGDILGLNADGTLAGSFELSTGTRYDFHSDFEGVEGIFVEHMDADGSMSGVICSDDQGTGNFADAVHRFHLVCSTETSSTSDAASTTSAPVSGGRYFQSEDGMCPEGNYITTVSECEAAAQALGFADVTTRTRESEDHPYGCFYSNQLWLNTDDENAESAEFEDGGGISLCKEEVSATSTVSPSSTTTEGSTTVPPSFTTEGSTTAGSTSTVPPSSTSPVMGYFQSDAGICPEGSETITTRSECEAAALELGFEDVTARTRESEDHPYGCHYTNQLWLNTDDEVEEPFESVTVLCLGALVTTESVTMEPTMSTMQSSSTTLDSTSTTQDSTSTTMESSMLTMEPTMATAEPTMPPTSTTMEPTPATEESTLEPTPAVMDTTLEPTLSTMEPAVTHEPTVDRFTDKPRPDVTYEPTESASDDEESGCFALSVFGMLIAILAL